MTREIEALKMMDRHGIACVPKVVAFDEALGCALLEWIDGNVVGQLSENDVDHVIAFMRAIHGLRHTRDAANCGCDTEACLSGAEIERQIINRLERLRSEASSEHCLRAFLENEFVPALDNFAAAARTQLQSAETDFESELPASLQSLVASDLGFHNALRKSDGSLIFFDFEYFGLDDPVKLIADMLQHPGVALPSWAAQKIRISAEQIYSDITGYQRRFDALFPLFGLRWCLIVLNDFIPERWQRRPRNRPETSWNAVKSHQLKKARKIFEGIGQPVSGAIDGSAG